MPFEVVGRERYVEIFDTAEPDRDFAVHDRIDDQRGVFGGSGERLTRPRQPVRVLGENVEQDVGITNVEPTSEFTSERHDLVSRHGDVTATAEAIHDLVAAARLLLCLHNADGIAIDGKLDLSTGTHADSLPNCHGDCHLTLAGKSHCRRLTGKSLTIGGEMMF